MRIVLVTAPANVVVKPGREFNIGLAVQASSFGVCEDQLSARRGRDLEKAVVKIPMATGAEGYEVLRGGGSALGIGNDVMKV